MDNALDLAAALAYSRYATVTLDARPNERELLYATVGSPFDWHEARETVAACVAKGDAKALSDTLRKLRRRVFIHAMARDLTGRARLDEVCAAMTTLAEVALSSATALHHPALAADFGEPRDEAGDAQELVIVGMGKLGGGELNVSSDIDIVFVYPEDGETDGRRTLGNREFFERLGRRVIGALHEITPEGFVFRVDTRLRPYGESGPLAVPYSALEQYLITQGRAWERYAWLKARALTGERHDELHALVTPFVFRKYLDYDAYDGLRDIHGQIAEQGRRNDYAQDVKLGPGGIREIEFIVQALQLVRGGREPDLRARGTLPALAAIEERGLLPAEAIAALRDAYVYLRNLEHRLQYRDDRQTQMLPADPAEREALARAMGAPSTADFERTLALHRSAVSGQFGGLFGPAPEARSTAASTSGSHDAAAPSLAAAWGNAVDRDRALAALEHAGYADAAGLLAHLARFRAGPRYLQLPALSQQRVDALVPQLLTAAGVAANDGADAQSVFHRLFGLLEAVSRRSAYLALLTEHPTMLPRLAHLMGASQWASDYLTRHPILLDELLDPRVLLAEPDWDAWRAELARMQAAADGVAERQMDALRHLLHAQTFRLLAQELAGTLTVERLADHLSALADIVLATTVAEAWKHLHHGAASPPDAPKFAIIGFGKLGGKELGYASDLDLVFLYDDADETAVERYTRLARRIITWLTSATAAGRLYDTDLRLRPDGAKGVLTSSFAGFCRYEREQAWTWEHQALTRARFVAGDASIGARFEAERESILRLKRDSATLTRDVVDMRRRMLAGHPNPSALFDLKHDAGGMVDVEFSVQYLILAHAHGHAALTRNAGNIALLGIAAELGLVPAATAQGAADAYREYRRLQHKIRLTGAPHARVNPGEQAERRAVVGALWKHVFGEPWREQQPGLLK
jgi:glutamate-ammonia-ligase adenylyltransferase